MTTAKRVSCTKLSDVLNKSGILDARFTPKTLRNNCEAYGRKVECYVSTGTVEKRAKLESHLTARGIKFHKDYSPGSAVVDVSVTYFKAWHHDE